jgi:hypothetical protein
VLDELRVWTRPRTAAEILASYKAGIDNPSSISGDLDFYWKFDTAGLTQGSTAVDSTGNGRTGAVGALVTTENQLQYSTGRPSQVPVAPLQLPSTAPIVSDGPVVVLIVSGSNEIVLRSVDDDGDDLTTKIGTAPSSGTLADITGSTVGAGGMVVDGTLKTNKRVYYTPTSYSTFSSDTFTCALSSHDRIQA